MFFIAFLFRNAIFICVSLKSFVNVFVSFPLYVKITHLVFCCLYVFLLCLHLFGCHVLKFLLYPLLCDVSCTLFSSFSFAYFYWRCVQSVH
jgi:hypothetical protein